VRAENACKGNEIVKYEERNLNPQDFKKIAGKIKTYRGRGGRPGRKFYVFPVIRNYSLQEKLHPHRGRGGGGVFYLLKAFF